MKLIKDISKKPYVPPRLRIHKLKTEGFLDGYVSANGQNQDAEGEWDSSKRMSPVVIDDIDEQINLEDEYEQTYYY